MCPLYNSPLYNCQVVQLSSCTCVSGTNDHCAFFTYMCSFHNYALYKWRVVLMSSSSCARCTTDHFVQFAVAQPASWQSRCTCVRCTNGHCTTWSLYNWLHVNYPLYMWPMWRCVSPSGGYARCKWKSQLKLSIWKIPCGLYTTGKNMEYLRFQRFFAFLVGCAGYFCTWNTFLQTDITFGGGN